MQYPRWGTSKVVGVGDKRLSRAIHDLEDFWKIMAEGGFLDFLLFSCSVVSHSLRPRGL